MYIFLKLLNCSVLRFLFKTILFDGLTPRIRNKYRSGNGSGELGHRQYCNRSTWADRFGFGGIISFPSGYAGAWYVA